MRGWEEVMRGRDGRVRKKMGRESEGKVKGWEVMKRREERVGEKTGGGVNSK